VKGEEGVGEGIKGEAKEEAVVSRLIGGGCCRQGKGGRWSIGVLLPEETLLEKAEKRETRFGRGVALLSFETGEMGERVSCEEGAVVYVEREGGAEM
jgi:hypothetical protein